MTDKAQRHLAKAKEYVAKGDSFYWKAGLEIVAAQEADPTLSNREIGKVFGRGEQWVRTIVRHVTTSSPDTNIDWQRGSHGTTAEIDAAVEKKLSDPEFVAQTIASDPAIARAVARSPIAVEAIGSEALNDALARHREQDMGQTMGEALTSPELQRKLAATSEKYALMRDVRHGVRALAKVDVEQYVRDEDDESLRLLGYDIEPAIENLSTLRSRITARLLEVNG